MEDMSNQLRGAHNETPRPQERRKGQGCIFEVYGKIKSLIENAETKSVIDQISRLIYKQWRRSIKPNLKHKLAREYKSLTEHFWVTNEDDFEFDTYTDRQARTTVDKGTHKFLVMKTIDLKTGKVAHPGPHGLDR